MDEVATTIKRTARTISSVSLKPVKKLPIHHDQQSQQTFHQSFRLPK